MRSGRLLAEKSPEALLQEYNTNLLEDIVLRLCRNDTFGTSNNETQADSNNDDANDPVADAIEEISFQSRARLSVSATTFMSGGPRFRNSVGSNNDAPSMLPGLSDISTNPLAQLQQQHQAPQRPRNLEKSLSSRSVISYKRRQSFKQDIHDEIHLGVSRLKALVRKNLILLMRNRKWVFKNYFLN